MYVDTFSELEIIVNNYDEKIINNNIESHWIRLIILEDRYDLIEVLYSKVYKEVEIEKYIFNGILKAHEANDTTLKCLDLLLKRNDIYYEIEDEEDEIYYMCQYDDSYDIIKTLIRLKTDIPWNFVLEMCSSYLIIDSVKYLSRNLTFGKNVLNKAFSSVIQSEVISGPRETEEQKTLLIFFIEEMNVDVNTNSINGEWETAYLECFFNYPRLTRYFYTSNFNKENLINKNFWSYQLEGLIDKEKYKEYNIDAFNSLKESNIDLGPLIKLFEELGYKDKADEFLR